MGFLTAMLLLMALRQSLTFVSGVGVGEDLSAEVPALAVSIMSFLAVLFIERILTKNTRTVLALRESQERYRSLVEDQVDLVCQSEPDGTLTFVNNSYADYFGRSPEDLVGSSFVDLVPEEEREGIRKYLKSFGPEKTVSNILHEVVDASGQRRWQEWTDHAFLDESGNVTGLQSIGRDVTERKLAEDALRQSEELNRRIIEAIPGGVVHVSRDGRVLKANEEARELLGVSESQLSSVSIVDLEPWTVFENGVTCPAEEYPATRCLRTGEAVEPLVLGTLRPTGEISWAIYTAVPVQDLDSGELEGVVVTFLDITARKVAEDALRDSEANQRALVQAVPDAMFRVTKEGVYRDFVPADGFEVLMDPKDFIGKALHDTLPPILAARAMKAVREALRTNQMQVFEYELQPTSDVRYYEARVVPDRAESVLCLVRDVTDRHLAEIEGQELLVELEAKNRELERFARTVSHDLKSPLITIRGFIEVLADDRSTASERAQQAIDRINAAAHTMLNLLDELLELARIGRFVSPLEEVPLGELVRSAVDQVAGRIVKAGVKVNIQPDLPEVYCDRVRLLQVLQNLIENAVKFMGDQERPRIEIGASRRERDVICWVRDNGSGIDKSNLDRVFGIFDRLHRDIEGTGIGLALVKRIIEIHGGKIWAESPGLGRGSTLFFTLPGRQAGHGESSVPAA